MEQLDDDERRESSATSSRLNDSDPSSKSRNEIKSQSDDEGDREDQNELIKEDEKETIEHFKILSWNIDGLDDENLESPSVVNKIIKFINAFF